MNQPRRQADGSLDVENFALPPWAVDESEPKDMLITTARSLKLPVSGSKAKLVQRIKQFYKDNEAKTLEELPWPPQTDQDREVINMRTNGWKTLPALLADYEARTREQNKKEECPIKIH